MKGVGYGVVGASYPRRVDPLPMYNPEPRENMTDGTIFEVANSDTKHPAILISDIC
jgi:hypothetical protein